MREFVVEVTKSLRKTYKVKAYDLQDAYKFALDAVDAADDTCTYEIKDLSRSYARNVEILKGREE